MTVNLSRLAIFLGPGSSPGHPTARCWDCILTQPSRDSSDACMSDVRCGFLETKQPMRTFPCTNVSVMLVENPTFFAWSWRPETNLTLTSELVDCLIEWHDARILIFISTPMLTH